MNKGSSNNDVIGKSRDARFCVSREGMRNQVVLWDEELTAIWLDGRRKILRLYWLARLERRAGKEFGIKKSATGDGALRGVTDCG